MKDIRFEVYKHKYSITLLPALSIYHTLNYAISITWLMWSVRLVKENY